jgi:Zn-dependent peptidase ImmA (M78 family)
MRQAEHLAGALHVPFGYLFLKQPPKDKLPLADFRTIANAAGKATPDLMDVVNDVIVKQQWYREFLIEEGEKPLPFVGQFNSSNDPAKIARSIRQTVGLEAIAHDSTNWDDFLRNFIKKCESIRILVMRSGIVGSNPHRKLRVDEFRGFTISDKLAPIIFINGTDARAAQIFTLAHELAHVWIGEGGISDEQMGNPDAPDSKIETLCNAVAAEVLVPMAEFFWRKDLDVNANVQAIAHRFKVSRLVALRRAMDLQYIDKPTFLREYRATESHYRQQEDNSQGGGNFFPTLFARNSRTFTTTVVGAVSEGKALYREAAQLLNVKVPTINKVIEYIDSGAQ